MLLAIESVQTHYLWKREEITMRLTRMDGSTALLINICMIVAAFAFPIFWIPVVINGIIFLFRYIKNRAQ